MRISGGQGRLNPSPGWIGGEENGTRGSLDWANW
jgi:hypothetical protein